MDRGLDFLGEQRLARLGGCGREVDLLPLDRHLGSSKDLHDGVRDLLTDTIAWNQGHTSRRERLDVWYYPSERTRGSNRYRVSNCFVINRYDESKSSTINQTIVDV